MASKINWEEHLPDQSLEFHEENLAEFFQVMEERQQIWFNRFAGAAKPWTKDSILRDNKFTNVYRELDRSSQYLISKSMLDETNTLKDLIFHIIMFRVINKPETFEKLGGFPKVKDFDGDKFVLDLLALQESGYNVLNDSAYKINTYIWVGEPRWYAYSEHIIKVLFNKLDKIVEVFKTGTIEEILAELRVYGVGKFLAHEFYQDFTYLTRYTKYEFRFTQNDYTNVGPGAVFGLKLVMPAFAKGEKKQAEAMSILSDLSQHYFRDFKYLGWDKKNKKYFVSNKGSISWHQIEMQLCEAAKYWKVKNKIGKQRSKINAGSGDKDYSFYLY